MVKHQFKDVVNATSSCETGILMVSDEGVAWASTEQQSGPGRKVVLKAPTLVKATWTPCGREALFHVYAKGKNEGDKDRYERFAGLKHSYKEDITAMCRDVFKIPLEELKLSTAGLNAGDLEVSKAKNALVMSFDGKTTMELPLSSIQQCVAPSKNDVEVHFHDDDTGPAGEDLLVEMKFYIPDDEDGNDVAPQLAQLINATAGITRVSGNVLCTLTEEVGQFVAPRGRYEVLLLADSFRMTGKTYEYKVAYKNVSRMFLLPKPEGHTSYFVISLDKPIMQGQQRYRHLIMQLDTRDDTLAITNLSKEELKDKYDGKLTAEMSGRLPEITAKVFKILTKKKVFVPGKFVSVHEAKAVKCALKTSTGFLYPLQKGLFFVHKPATHIRYEDIEYMEFQRYSPTGSSGGAPASRNFDLYVQERTGAKSTYLFSSIDSREYTLLFNFLSTKDVRIRNLREAAADANVKDADDDDDDFLRTFADDDEESDDDDFGSADEKHGSDSDEGSDVSLASDEGVDAAGSSDDDDDDDDSDGDDSGAKKKKKKKSKKEKGRAGKKKAVASSSSKRGAKKKRQRDANAPKVASSAYNLFGAEMRAEAKAADTKISFGELGEAWKKVDPKRKEALEEQAKADKKRYEKELESYEPPEGYDAHGLEIIDDAKSPKSAKPKPKPKPKPSNKRKASAVSPKTAKPGEPKMARKGVDFFKDALAAKGEPTKDAAAKYKAMTKEEKDPYKKMYIADVQRYNDEVEKWNEEHHKEGDDDGDDSDSSSSSDDDDDDDEDDEDKEPKTKKTKTDE